MTASDGKSIAAAVPFDQTALCAYLARTLGVEGPFVVTPVAGGQSNPTFFVDAPRRRMVLRKRPPGVLLPSAHAIDREFTVQTALAGSGVPVAPMLHYCEDETVVGASFYLMERVEGRIFQDSTLDASPPEERRTMYREAARTLAAIHDVDIDAVGLGGFGRRDGYLERQLKRWSEQWRLSAVADDPVMERLIAWLQANMPQEEQTRLTHGDFRIGNLIFDPVEPRVAAVLDWELSTLGDPLLDLAHSCIFAWHVKPDEYGGMLGVDLAARKLPTLDQFIVDYRAASSAPQQLGAYHLAFALFRNAAIFEGIAARARQGNASSGDAAKVGALAPLFTRRAAELAGI